MDKAEWPVRGRFRDWAAEETDHPREVIEAAPAHVVPNKVEAVYAWADLLDRRRLLMDDWGPIWTEIDDGGFLPAPLKRCRPSQPGSAQLRAP